MTRYKSDIPIVEYIRVRNYRSLYDLELKNITPLTVFLGPNGSGKSTILDVFAFLAECFSIGLRKAWDKRGRFRELRTRGMDGPITITLKYRIGNNGPITYHLSINENQKGPYVVEESLGDYLDYKQGIGSFKFWDENAWDEYTKVVKISSDVLALHVLGHFLHPTIDISSFIANWYLYYLTADNTRKVYEIGPRERLSITGDNLSNVIQYLKEQHPERLDKILSILASRVPRLERVDTDFLADGRLLLRIKDAPFDQPILARFASDGTLKMLAYLTILYDPDPPQLTGIEEPENHLHPRLLGELAEECRRASENTQLIITTHSPFFVNGLRPEEVWVLFRNEHGFTEARRTSDIPHIKQLVDDGALLGQLWLEGYFGVGDPLTASGGPISSIYRK